MVGRICAGLFALAVIGFFIFGFVFYEAFHQWTDKPSLFSYLIQSSWGLIILVDVAAALLLQVLTGFRLFGAKDVVNKGALGGVYIIAFGLAWIILSFSSISLSWSWGSALEIFLLGLLLSPAAAAMVYALWPYALAAKRGTTTS